MKVDGELLNNLETLARIKTEPGQAQKIIDQLNEIIAYADTLGELDAAGCGRPCRTDGAAALRDDTVTESADADSLVRNSPDSGGGFAVPKTV